MSDPVETLSLEVEAEGRVHLPAQVLEDLGLEPGDLLALTQNTISVRLDLYKELTEDLRRSVKEPQRWRYLDQFPKRKLTSVESDGSVVIPPEVLRVTPRDRLTLDVVTEGLRSALYLFRDDG